MIEAKSINIRQITDDASFIQQYNDLTEIITLIAAKVFGNRKAFKPPKEVIMNGTIQKVMCQMRTVGGAILFEKSNWTHHVSLKAMKHHSLARHAYDESGSCLSFLKHLN